MAWLKLPPSMRIRHRVSANLIQVFVSIILMLLLLDSHAVASAEKSWLHGYTSVESYTDLNGGYGYRLEYLVPADINAFWRFKTDFNGDFLLSNELITAHRVVSATGNTVITENRYSTAPGLKFLWQTTVIPENYRLEFELINPGDCRQDFHFGSIQLSPAGDYTKVTQIAAFKFRGAALWVKYPWYGGMRYTLNKVVRWEQKTAVDYIRRSLIAARR
jgi:hypothetical protein